MTHESLVARLEHAVSRFASEQREQTEIIAKVLANVSLLVTQNNVLDKRQDAAEVRLRAIESTLERLGCQQAPQAISISPDPTTCASGEGE